MSDVLEIPVTALIKLPRHTPVAEIGGPRQVAVSRGLKCVSKTPNAVSRAAGTLYYFERLAEDGPESWLVVAFSLTNKEAGNPRPDIEAYEEGEYHLEEVGTVPVGIVYNHTSTNGNRLSLLCADLGKEFMSKAEIPHYLLLPKRVPSSVRFSEYCQLWVSL